MNDSVRLLFHELADLPRSEWQKVLAERQIGAELRAEVESLLSFDSAKDHGLTERVSQAAQDALLSTHEGEWGDCGPYRPVRLLGSGGMGAVYLAERTDGEIQQRVAVKVLRRGAERPAWRERFLRERQLLASLNHPAIARVIDAGHTADGRPYFVMEYVDGVPIDEYAAGKGLWEQLALFVRVCEAVSHAHGHLIIHRDLKPSNILVDAAGQPKLLDFGIAKLLDETGDPTQTIDRLLTPHYASPEQFRGAHQSTASDVYSLAAVLYKLLTRRSPHESVEGTAQMMDVLTGAREIPLPSRLNPDLPTDIDYILRKALRHAPNERYASVEAFARDVRAILEFRPVQARAGDRWYRGRKWLRRRWMPIAAATVTLTALSLGLFVANRERAIAQRRFQQVRQLANKVFGLDTIVQGVPGSIKARHEIAAMTREYLEALAPESLADQDLALEIGVAYLRLARVQGVPTGQNLGQYAAAEESLRRGEGLIEPLLASVPQKGKALLTSAEISEARMILADSAGRDEEALAHARRLVTRLDAFLGLATPLPNEVTRAAAMLGNVALAHKNMHRLDESISYARRSAELARSLPESQTFLANALSVLADAMRQSGDLPAALEAIREARAAVDRAVFPNAAARQTRMFPVLWREGVILGGEGTINLNRPEEAIAVLKQAFNVIEDGARRDPSDASSRMLFASAGRELGNILRRRDPSRALAVYDHALHRLGEVKNNTKARREEAELLAGSAYALRRLNRAGEAKSRIETAFQRLRGTGDYPAEQIDPDDQVEAVLRALADQFAEGGEPQRAAQVYQDLLDKVLAAKPDPQNNLLHAAALSRIYGGLASLYRRINEPDRAESLSAAHRKLWEGWDRKLPNHDFVRRQLQAVAP